MNLKDFFITSAGELKRKDNSLIFLNEKFKKIIPVKTIDSLYFFGEISFNTKLINFLSQLKIPIYFFNYYGFYSGVFAPREKNISGKLLIKQVENYVDSNKRLFLAKTFVDGSRHNMRKTLMQYDLIKESEELNKFKEKIMNTTKITNLLLIEAEIRKKYYKAFNKIIKDKEFEFIKRVKRPPNNFINCLISFGNSLLYTTILSELFKTQLNPTISYLHEPFERRYSLNLDIADVFKPLIVDRVIFSLINQKIIKPADFDKSLNYAYLNKSGRQKFLKEYDKKLQTTIKYPKLNRKVSYKYMLRLEAYKLIKHLLEEEKFKAFKIYW